MRGRAITLDEKNLSEAGAAEKQGIYLLEVADFTKEIKGQTADVVVVGEASHGVRLSRSSGVCVPPLH
jgi:hypothetical protein